MPMASMDVLAIFFIVYINTCAGTHACKYGRNWPVQVVLL